MRPLRLLLPLVLVTPAFVGAAPAQASATSFVANMRADEVKPIPGPPGATGTARIVADQDAQKVCYELTYDGPDKGQITAAHIHRGEKGMNGPVTINLDINGSCVNPAPAEIKALIDWPDGYYVEIHTLYQQNGAVRGQTVVVGGAAPAHQPPHQH